MRVVLGVDPAWSSKNDSAVALAVDDGTGWRLSRIAPSFAAFVGSEDRNATFDSVLAFAEERAGHRIDVAAVDMPLATIDIAKRRASDSLVSSRYGGRGCAVHSPTAERPGPLASAFRDALARHGLPLVVTKREPVLSPCAIEVYPHVLLLALLDADYRVPYKVGRARSYWKGATASERRTLLLAWWRKILGALAASMTMSWTVPDAPQARELKALEDQLDALICVWGAIRYLEGQLVPLGDRESAIWCPLDLE